MVKHEHKMDTLEILKHSMKGSKHNAVHMHEALAQLVKTDKNFRIMRANNTLFSYYNLNDGSVEVTMDTADNARDLIESIQEFCKAMKICGFKKGIFAVVNNDILRVDDKHVVSE